MHNQGICYLMIAIIFIFLHIPDAHSQLVLINNDHIQQDSPGLDSSRQLDAQFGFSLAAYRNKLVIGSPGTLVNGNKAGAVYRLPSGRAGIFQYPHLFEKFFQDTPGIPGGSENGDNFGYSVAIGKFAWIYEACDTENDDCNGYMDVIAGVPYEDLSGDDHAGMVNMVFPGTDDCDVYALGNCGLSYNPLDQIYQSNGLDGSSEPGDRFGFALAVGDFDGDDMHDLAIGVPGEAVNSNQV